MHLAPNVIVIALNERVGNWLRAKNIVDQCRRRISHRATAGARIRPGKLHVIQVGLPGRVLRIQIEQPG